MGTGTILPPYYVHKNEQGKQTNEFGENFCKISFQVRMDLQTPGTTQEDYPYYDYPYYDYPYYDYPYYEMMAKTKDKKTTFVHHCMQA